MTNRDWQKYGERFALHILTDKLNVPREKINDYESPDFIFKYKGKTIGAEVVEYHKNPKITEARKAFQRAIDKYKAKHGKLTSVIVFPEDVATFNGKKSEEKLLEDIDNLLIDQDYDSRHIQSADEWEFDLESELPVSVCTIGICQHVKVDVLEQTIRNKEKKLTEYKSLHKDIDEYWLIVYVDQYEYDYIDKMEKPKIESTYNRIYLTHLSDGVLRIK
jgi:hypothetical protein